MKSRIIAAAFAFAAGASLPAVAQADLIRVGQATITYKHDGAACLLFQTNKTGDQFFAINSAPLSLEGGGMIDARPSAAANAVDVILHFLLGVPVSFSYDPTVVIECATEGFKAVDFDQ
jgi:hypothetical protein